MEERDKPGKEQRDAWHADPKNWKWGDFYYNPEDRRLFPPKRNKWAGWTVNFANPYSVFVSVILIISILVTIILLMNYK